MTKTPSKAENNRRICVPALAHTAPGCHQPVHSGSRENAMTRSCTISVFSEIYGPASASATRVVSEQSPWALNRAQLDACSKPGPIAFAALKSAYAAKLTTGGIEGAFVLLVQTNCGLARTDLEIMLNSHTRCQHPQRTPLAPSGPELVMPYSPHRSTDDRTALLQYKAIYDINSEEFDERSDVVS